MTPSVQVDNPSLSDKAPPPGNPWKLSDVKISVANQLVATLTDNVAILDGDGNFVFTGLSTSISWGGDMKLWLQLLNINGHLIHDVPFPDSTIACHDKRRPYKIQHAYTGIFPTWVNLFAQCEQHWHKCPAGDGIA
jgi:hypothetical protein